MYEQHLIANIRDKETRIDFFVKRRYWLWRLGPCSWTILPWSNVIQSDPNWSNVIQTDPNVIQTDPTWFKLIQIDPTWSKLIQSNSNWFKLIQNYPNWF